MKQVIATNEAPAAIGPYSQAVRAGDTVYLSGQIPLDPKSMQVVDGFDNQVRRVFDNLRAVCIAAGGDLDDVVRVTIYLTEPANFPRVNEIMAACFRDPFPARATVGVASLPRGAAVEIDAILYLPPPESRG